MMLSIGLANVPTAEAAGTVTNCSTYGSPGTVGDLAWALVGGGAVTFSCSGTILVPEIFLPQDTILDGTGQSVTLSGGGSNRVLQVHESTVELRAISVMDGSSSFGAGVLNAFGTLILNNSIVSGNSASGDGGGIRNNVGTLTLINSVVSGNSAGSTGGGIDNNGGTVTLTNSTVSGNAAIFGGPGGIRNGGTLTLTNSTVSGNNAIAAAGIFNLGTLTLINSTVSGNNRTSPFGGPGGIRNDGTLTLISSIIAQQSQGANCSNFGTITSEGYNLDSDGSCNLTAVGDISNGLADLLPLAPNAPGATATHALGPNSQAHDAIPSGTNGCGTTITTDQRGVSRPQGTNCDIGAFEVEVEQLVTHFFLHGSGGIANPPTLTLDEFGPTSTTAKYKDSGPVNFSGGNPWQEIGTWSAGLVEGSLAGLSDLQVWLGLKNSDDQGARFDLLAEIYRTDELVASGLMRCIEGVTRNASKAKEVAVTFDPFAPTDFDGAMDELRLRLFTRVGTNLDGSKCGGHSNAVGLRVYFDAVNRASQFEAVAP
jgi:hypothetical protein